MPLSMPYTHHIRVEDQIQLAHVLEALVQRLDEDLSTIVTANHDVHCVLTWMRSRMASSLSEASTAKRK